MKNWTVWLRQRWPGVKGRRAIDARLTRLEARMLEMQIQSGRSFTALGRTFEDATRLMEAHTENIGQLADRMDGHFESRSQAIGALAERLGARQNVLERLLDEAAARIEAMRDGVAADLRGLEERLDLRFGALQHVAESGLSAVAAAKEAALELMGAEFGHMASALKVSHGGLVDQLAVLDALTRQTQTDVERILGSTLPDVRAALADITRDILAAEAGSEQRRRSVEEVLQRYRAEATESSDQLREIVLAAEGASEQRHRLVDELLQQSRAESIELSGQLRDMLATLASRVSDMPDRFLSVEAAAKARHESLVSLTPNIETLAGILDAHRLEIRGRLDALDDLRHAMAVLERLVREDGERQRDLDVIWGEGVPPSGWPAAFRLQTDHPVALHSDDHRFPRGTANDNTRSPRFVAACERLFNRAITHLDLGCAGGGLVRDFLIRGHRSMGLEGSDLSLLEQRAEWRALGARLRTCDITQPFDILDEAGMTVGFDVISAWEVLEHLPRESLPRFFDNVRRHLAPEGLFVASVALFEDRDPESGAVWHVTLEPREWWSQQMAEAGLQLMASPFVTRDYVRGSGSSFDDWDAADQPHMGFHIVARVGS